MHTDQAVTTNDSFFREYTSPDAIRKYTRASAGFGISSLLDSDYKQIYLDALRLLPDEMKQRGLRILEFGCGGGMNLVHLVGVLKREGINVERAIGTDFSPVLVEAAKKEGSNYLPEEDLRKVEFYVANNETLPNDLASALGEERARVEGSSHFILGVNTIRYAHRAGKQFDVANDLRDLLAPGGVCVNIDMNDRFPAFRSALKKRVSGQRENPEECYLPSLAEYTEPFAKAGFRIVRSDNFCWVPHSGGPLMTNVLRALTPVLNAVARSRAMRSLVVAQKPAA